MAGDGILSIGATVDKTGVDEGLGSIKEGVQLTVQQIAVQVEETCAKSKAAWNKLSEDVKAAATNVSAESLKVAEATKAQTAALADLRRASVLAKDAKLDEAVSTGILAAAQQKVAAASAQVAAAKKEEAAAVAEAAEEEALSSNVIIAAFQRVAMAAQETMTVVQEKLVATAETATETGSVMTAAFSGLGEVLGVGLVIGFAAHFMDETAKVNIELGHLHEKTGIAIEDLSGLQALVKESGGQWEAVSTGLIRMNKNLADSAEPSKALVNALAGVGLKVQDLKGLKPEEQLEKIAVAFARTDNAGNRAAAAIAVFGKGGAALIPILAQQGGHLAENIRLIQQQTGVTEDSVAESERWQRSMAAVSREFQKWGNFLVENAHYVQAMLLAVGESIFTVFRYAWAAIEAGGLTIAKLAMTIDDLRNARIWALKQDMADLKDSLTVPFKEATADVEHYWSVVANTWKGAKEQPRMTTVDTPDDGGGTGGGGGGGKGKVKGAASPAGVVLPPQTESPDVSAASQQFIEELQEESKAKQDAVREEMQADREAAEEKIRLAEQDYQQVEKQTAFEVQVGRMTPQQRLAALRDAAAQEEQVRLQQSTFLQMLDMNDQKRYEQDLKQQVQAVRQYVAQIQQLNQQGALSVAKSWQQAFDRMSDTFASNTSKWITGQESLGRAWSKTLVGMTQTVITNLLKQAVAYITHAATVQAVQEREKLQDAAAAARKTYVAVAAIPYVGPFLAPPAAAAAFAAVEAFEQGGIVKGMPGGAVPILAHAGERVLSHSQTTNFEKLVNNSSSSTTINPQFHYSPRISGIDGASVESMARRHGSTFTREAMRQLRLSNRI
jgi:hypothetical protein